MAENEADLWESAKGNDIARLGYLLAGGEDINQRDDRGLTPLHVAATAGAVEAAKLLLLRGADPNSSDWESGWTPLHRSFYFGHVKLSLLLLKYGGKLADEPERDWRKDLSVNRPHNRCISSCDEWDIHDHDGNTPLDLLSEHLKCYLQDATARRAEVFTFGKADFQLGILLPNASDVVKPKRIEDLVGSSITAVAAAKYHSLALTSSGDVYSWGHGRGGRLGHGDENAYPAPHRIESLHGKRVVRISAGENHTLAVTDEGELFTWGADRFGQLGHGNAGGKARLEPKRVEYLRRWFITDAAAGASHSIATTDAGEVYCWGSNKSGQLGLKEAETSNNQCTTPHLVDYVVGARAAKTVIKRKVLQVAAGSFNSLIIASIENKQPEVFQWGWTVNTPQRVSFLSRTGKQDKTGIIERDGVVFHANLQPTIVQVTAGKYHNVALSTWGHVFTWGIGADILGHGPAEPFSIKPQLVEALLPENGGGKVVQVSASTNRTCAVTETGDLYTWGSTEENGVLGNGSARYQPVPKQVTGIKRVVRVAAGEDHTLAVLGASLPPLPHEELINTHDTPFETKMQSHTPIRAAEIPASAQRLMQEDYQPVDPDHIEIPFTFEMDADFEEKEDTAHVAISAATTANVVPTLKQLCEHRISQEINTKNAVSLLATAEVISSEALVQFAAEYIRRNFDAILVRGKQSDLDQLLEDAGESVNHLLDTADIPGHKIVDEPSASAKSKTKEANDLASISKAIKIVKKKLAAVDELANARALGRDLLPEQLEKLERRDAHARELRNLERRFTMEQKRQHMLQAFTATAQPPLAAPEAPEVEETPCASTPQPSQAVNSPQHTRIRGKAKFIPLQQHEERTSKPQKQPEPAQESVLPILAATPQTPESPPIALDKKPRAAWGTVAKSVQTTSSTPIPITPSAKNVGTGTSSPLTTPVKQPHLGTSPSSSPSASYSLAAFITNKPKRKTQRSAEKAEVSSSPSSERGWNVPVSGSPSSKSMLDIQKEEERRRIVAAPQLHDGNDSAWFVDRRQASELEEIIAEQEAIAAVERFERMEAERLQQEAAQRAKNEPPSGKGQGSSRRGSRSNTKQKAERPPPTAEKPPSERRAEHKQQESAERPREKQKRYKARKQDSNADVHASVAAATSHI